MPLQIERWPQTDNELWEFIHTIWGLKIPRKAVCSDHSAPFDAFCEAYWARSPVIVWKASRGLGGKSILLATLALTEAVCLGAQVVVLGGSASQSQNVHEATQAAWSAEWAPRELLVTEPTQYKTTISNGGWIRALMASQRSVRGPHPQRLRLDEIDEMEIEILEAAQGQPMTAKGIKAQTVLSSTHQYSEGTMTEMLRRAEINGWPIFNWCFKETSDSETGWLSQAQIEQKQQEVSSQMWTTEFCLQEPAFEGRVFNIDTIDNVFAPPTILDDSGLLTFGTPDYTHRYITGVDWAKERDWTVIVTFDATANPDQWQLVAYERIGRTTWPVMVTRFEERLRTWGGVGVHDATGIGNVVEDFIDPRFSSQIRGQVLAAGKRRSEILSDYVGAIEHNAISWPRIEYAYKEHRLLTIKDLFGSGHVPDTFMAAALAWSSRSNIVTLPPGLSIDTFEKPSYWKAI